ncbi:hypothetical protein [Devosia sp.]|uniref:hypothetical protein n=1 Tax=Devosia sp. TaxID=1871048 RepID=UPI0032657EBC
MGSYAKYLLAKNIFLGQFLPMILVARIMLVLVAALMFSASTAHAAMPMAPAHAGSISVMQCDGEVVKCGEALDHHGSSEQQVPSCCAMSCHVGLQPCFGHQTFLTMTKLVHSKELVRFAVKAPQTSLERPPRLA